MLSTSCSRYVIIVLKLWIEPEMTTKTDIHEKLIITMGSKLINKTMILIAIVPQATPRSCFLSCDLSLCPFSSSSFFFILFFFIYSKNIMANMLTACNIIMNIYSPRLTILNYINNSTTNFFDVSPMHAWKQPSRKEREKSVNFFFFFEITNRILFVKYQHWYTMLNM